MKSMTWPRPKLGSRRSRSVRFPSTPPSSSPKTIAQAIERMRRANHTMKVITPAARIVKIHVMPLASENAAPGFRTNCHWSREPSTGTTSPSVRFETTRNLLSWSRPYAARAAPATTRRAVVVPTFAARSAAKALEGRRRLLCGQARGTDRRREALVAGDLHRSCGVELAQLPLDVVLELRAVVALEDPQLVDALLERNALLVEDADLRTLLGLGLGDDARRGGVAFGDERIALLDAFAHVLLVETSCELQQVRRRRLLVEVRLRLRDLRRHRHRGRRSSRLGVDRGRGRRGGSLRGIRGTGLGRRHALAQLLVLLIQPTKLDHDLVEEVVDLVLVVAFPELRRLEALVDHIFRS